MYLCLISNLVTRLSQDEPKLAGIPCIRNCLPGNEVIGSSRPYLSGSTVPRLGIIQASSSSHGLDKVLHGWIGDELRRSTLSKNGLCYDL